MSTAANFIGPPYPDTRNRGFIGAWRKGAHARAGGRSTGTCPYDRGATSIVGGVRVMCTWERAFATYWLDGWRAMAALAKAGKE